MPASTGIAGVKVSNGRDLVVSDGQGRYRLPERPSSTVFVIKPAGYRDGDRRQRPAAILDPPLSRMACRSCAMAAS
jgi:hypothetical protein